MVLCWVMVYSGGHEQCRSCSLGFRAVLVGLAVSPGALAVRRSFIRQYWPVHTDKLWEVGPFAGRAWRGHYFWGNGKG
jgi:hypothetical protein